MRKKIKIIPILPLTLLACDKTNTRNTQSSSLINNNDSPKKTKNALIRDLLNNKDNDWKNTISCLQSNEVNERDLLESDKNILRFNEENIRRDLKKDENLLEYFCNLIGASSSSPTYGSNTGKYTTQRANLKQDLYNDMTDLFSKIQKEKNDDTPFCVDLYLFLSLCLAEKNNFENVLNNFKEFFWSLKKEDLKLIFDKEKYKILGGELELKKQIFQNVNNILKNFIKSVPVDDFKKKLERDRYNYKDGGFRFPIISGTEWAIAEMCRLFRIDYNEKFNGIISTENPEIFRSFCLVFTTYILQNFVKHIKRNNDGDCEVESFNNGCGILSDKNPFCFLGQEVVGLVWAIMNTAISSFDIYKDKPTNEFGIDLSMGKLTSEMSEKDIRSAIRNSLLGGAGFYYKEKGKEIINEWKNKNIDPKDIVSAGNFATMDIRYFLRFITYNCFNGGSWDNENTFINQISEPKPTIGSLNFKDEKDMNLFKGSMFAVNECFFIGSTNEGKASGYYFFNFDTSTTLISECSKFNNINDLKKISKNIAINIPKDIKGNPKESKWYSIIKFKSDLPNYNEFYNDILKPLYNNFPNSLKPWPAKTSPLTANSDFYFSVVYRTYETIGMYYLFNLICKDDKWIVKPN